MLEERGERFFEVLDEMRRVLKHIVRVKLARDRIHIHRIWFLQVQRFWIFELVCTGLDNCQKLWSQM